MKHRVPSRLVRWAVIGVTPVLTAAMLAGCSSSDSEAPTSSDAKISFTLPVIFDLTGPLGVYGQSDLLGAQLAVDLANKSGEFDITLEVHDSASDPNTALSEANEIIRNRNLPVMMFGGGSQQAVAIAPLAQSSGIPLVAVQSYSAGVIDQGDFVFRASTPQEFFYPALAEYAASQGIKTNALIYQNDSPTIKDIGDRVWPASAKEVGIEVVKTFSAPGSQTDFSSFASEIAAANPDSVFVSFGGAINANVIQALHAAGWQGTVLGGPPLAGNVLPPLGAEADGTIYTETFSPATTTESGKAFVEAFKAANDGKLPDSFAAEAYDGVQVILAAAKLIEGDLTRESFKEALQKVYSEGKVSGATGDPLVLIPERDSRTPGVIQVFRDGRPHLVSP